MNKKLLTLAVATAMVAPGAVMADAVLYGKLHVSVDYVDISNVVLPVYNRDGSYVEVRVPGTDGGTRLLSGSDYDGWGMGGRAFDGYVNADYANASPAMQGRGSRIGVKGSEDLGNGLKAIYQVEFQVNLQDTNNNIVGNNDAITYRNTFVGLTGDWGTALLGRHDTPLKMSTGKLDLFADTLADFNILGFHDLRADQVIAYVSPSFAGFQLMGAAVAPGGATAGSGLNTNLDSLAEAYSIAGIYSNGPFYASLAYESLGSEHFMSQATSDSLGTCDAASVFYNPATCARTDSDWNKWRIGLGLLDWNGFTLTAMYEDQDDLPVGQTTFAQHSGLGVNIPNGSESAKMWQVQAGYRFGNSMVKAMYGQMDRDGSYSIPDNVVTLTAFERSQLNDYYNGDRDVWAIGFDHNLSKRTKAYAVYTDVSDDRKNVGAHPFLGIAPATAGAEWSGFSVGVVHDF